MRVGYSRVSSRDQVLDSQVDSLTADGCEKVFREMASGKLARRPELDRALEQLREGDTLVITRLDRLGRSLEHLIVLSRQMQERGIQLRVLEQGIDTSTAVGRMFFAVLGAVAEFERALMSERTLEGLAAARARGRVGGARVKLGPLQRQAMREMLDRKAPDGKPQFTVAKIAAEFGVARATVYNYLDLDA